MIDKIPIYSHLPLQHNLQILYGFLLIYRIQKLCRLLKYTLKHPKSAEDPQRICRERARKEQKKHRGSTEEA